MTNLTASWMPVADAVVKATVVLACAGGATFLLRRGSAALRHLIWTLGLASALAMPLLTLALPRWELPIVSVPRAESAAAPLPADAVSRPAPVLGRASASARSESGAVPVQPRGTTSAW